MLELAHSNSQKSLHVGVHLDRRAIIPCDSFPCLYRCRFKDVVVHTHLYMSNEQIPTGLAPSHSSSRLDLSIGSKSQSQQARDLAMIADRSSGLPVMM